MSVRFFIPASASIAGQVPDPVTHSGVLSDSLTNTITFLSADQTAGLSGLQKLDTIDSLPGNPTKDAVDTLADLGTALART